MSDARFPFSAVSGGEDVKLALLLVAVDPRLGGVLLRGDKGTAKTTLARGLAALLPGQAPFVELPVGATEDRVVGSLDVARALTGGELHVRTGLLAQAHGGVLYVDEVNLLPDHLVDVLLDVAASGVNRIEREGLSHAHPARFVLIGSMNPEEGELRPQFLDRFGLCVDADAPADPVTRAEALRRRLSFDDATGWDTSAWEEAERETAARVAAAVAQPPAVLGADLLEAVAGICLDMGVAGLRADLAICRAAAALARLEGRSEVEADDVRRVAPMALAHRARRDPFDTHGTSRDALDEALGARLAPPAGRPSGDGGAPTGPGSGDEEEPDEIEGAPPTGGGPRSGSGGDSPAGANPGTAAGAGGDPVETPPPAAAAPRLGIPRLAAEGRSAEGPAPALGRRTAVEGPTGRLVGDRLPGPGGPSGVAVAATVRAAVQRRASGGGDATVEAGDVREAVRVQRSASLVVVAVDASGSMGAEARLRVAKGAVIGLLLDAYQRRDKVALVTFRDDAATVALRPTSSVEVATARLGQLPTGGRTPLAAGITTALALATAATSGPLRPLLVLVTDGRATAAPDGRDPVEAATAAAREVRRSGIAAVVVDVEEGPVQLGLAGDLAAAMGATLLRLPHLDAPALVAAVRALPASRRQ